MVNIFRDKFTIKAALNGIKALTKAEVKLSKTKAIRTFGKNMTSKVILFVDDEPNILSGLKRMLRVLHKQMDLHFVESGKDALDFMAETPIDVIVTDMRMPSMDGATLLKHVQQQYPQVLRIILSGHADRDAIFKTVGVAHQYLAKPTSAEALKKVLIRICSMQDIQSNISLKKLVAKIGNLPSIPSVYKELEEKLQSGEYSIDDIAPIIEKDLAMSAKILQLVNSSFFGLFKNIESPSKAVALLGLETIRSLVLNVKIFSKLTSDKQQHCNTIEQIWQHSLGVAVFAKTICKFENQETQTTNNAFIAGMLHDIGKLLFITSDEVDYQRILDLKQKKQCPTHIAEKELLQFDHAEVGGYLTGLWGIDNQIVEAIIYHHRIAAYPSPSFSPALAVHVADYIYNILDEQENVIISKPDMNYLHRAGIDTDRINHWKEICSVVDLPQPTRVQPKSQL